LVATALSNSEKTAIQGNRLALAWKGGMEHKAEKKNSPIAAHVVQPPRSETKGAKGKRTTRGENKQKTKTGCMS